MPDDHDSPRPHKKRRTDDQPPGGTVYKEIHLRNAIKTVPAVIKRKWQLRKNKDAIVPPQPNRTLLPRKGMTNATTEMIASNAHASREQQIAAAAITDWTSISAFSETPEYHLRDNNTARCHILADSNIKIIVLEIIAKLKGGDINENQENALMDFLHALNSLKAGNILKALRELAVKSPSSGLQAEDVAHILSHGNENLFFGNSARNEFILVGLDIPFVDRQPDPRAIRIKDAVINLAAHDFINFLTALNATSPTYDRRDGLAVSSSSQTRYDPMEVVSSATPSLKRKRAGSVSW